MPTPGLLLLSTAPKEADFTGPPMKMSRRRQVTLWKVLDEVFADEDRDYDAETADCMSDICQTVAKKETRS